MSSDHPERNLQKSPKASLAYAYGPPTLGKIDEA
jgi:hypothetical protein